MGSTPFLFKSVVLKIIAFCQVNHVFLQVNYDKHSSFEFLIWLQFSKFWFRKSEKLPCKSLEEIFNMFLSAVAVFQSRETSFQIFLTCSFQKVKPPSNRCNSSQHLPAYRGKWKSWRASKRFILLARLGKLPCHKKLGIFKFMFSLSDINFL
jgi:hypothetical protein